MKTSLCLCAAMLAGYMAFAVHAEGDRAELIKNLNAARERAAKYLLSQHQGDGMFGKAQPCDMPGVTAIVLRSLAKYSDAYRPSKNEAVKKGVEYMLHCQDSNGAIYLKEYGIENLNTCVVLSAMKALEDPSLAPAMQRAQDYILSCQSLDVKGVEPERDGSFSEGKEANFNLMSTSMSLDVLHETGFDPASPVWKKASAFVRRCQDQTEINRTPQMQTGDNTGGFVYYPGFSEHGMIKTRSGKQAPAPYGSMTYEAVKSLVYCGVDPADPAIQAAYKFLLQNYSPAENPGAIHNQAYFYYALTFAKSFSALNKKELELPDGRKANWAADLSQTLIQLQRADGSFLHTDPRWMEDKTVVCTSFALEALTLCAKALQ